MWNLTIIKTAKWIHSSAHLTGLTMIAIVFWVQVLVGCVIFFPFTFSPNRFSSHNQSQSLVSSVPGHRKQQTWVFTRFYPYFCWPWWGLGAAWRRCPWAPSAPEITAALLTQSAPPRCHVPTGRYENIRYFNVAYEICIICKDTERGWKVSRE